MVFIVIDENTIVHQYKMPLGPFNLLEIERISGAQAIISPDKLGCSTFFIKNVANLETATSDDLCVLHNKRYLRALKKSSAGACLIQKNLADYVPERMIKLIHPNPYKAFALIAQAFYPAPIIDTYRADTAFVAGTAQIGKNCKIEHGAYIGENVKIGDDSQIGVNTYIGPNVIIGNHCIIENQVSITNTIMGDHVVIYPGARIGQDGFGFASDEKGHYKIPHIGKVIIGHHVEIHANTCIDRGTLDNTVISDYCRIDNLVQIGHNVKIGTGTIMAGQSGIAGSTQIGKGVMLGGQVGISGHLNIGDRAVIVAGSGVIRNVEPHEEQGGYPAISKRAWHRQSTFLKKMVKNPKVSK